MTILAFQAQALAAPLASVGRGVEAHAQLVRLYHGLDPLKVPLKDFSRHVLKKAQFDLEQFLSEGHAVYHFPSGKRLLFWLRMGKTEAEPRFGTVFSNVVAGAAIDIFDLDATGSQWVGRCDRLIADRIFEKVGVEPHTGLAQISANKTWTHDMLWNHYPELTAKSLDTFFVEQTLSAGPYSYALWLEAPYRNHGQILGGFSNLGRALITLMDLASVAYFEITRIYFGVGAQSEGFHHAMGAGPTNHPYIWVRTIKLPIHFEPIQHHNALRRNAGVSASG